jgi:predicted ATPase
LLLVLDNCEHLLAAAADIVEQIVRTAPGVHVLVTSREGLGVAGEHLRAVPSLGLPESDADTETIAASDAVRLFVERAREASASYQFTDADAVAVAELCRRLDGIPLAIELAAARVPALTPAEIATLLDQRFRLLTGGRRAAVTRHHTLRNAIEWSYQLLEPEERVVLDRLAVFASGFDLASAQAVAADDAVDAVDVVDVLARLVGKSLVVAEPRGQQTRYKLLETVRDFAWERLQDAGDVATIGRRHAMYFAAFAHEAGTGLRSPSEADWIERVEREVDNLRAALAWAIAADYVGLALEPVSDLAWLGGMVSPYGRAAEDAARLAESHPLAAVALAAASFAAVLQGDVEAARTLGTEARDRAAALDRSPENLWVRCRVANATCAIFTLDTAGIDAFADAWLADARELGDPWCLCEALTFIVGVPSRDDAVAAGEEALEIARRLHVPSRIAFAAALLAARVAERDPERAEALFEEARAATPAAGNEWVDYVTSMALVHFYLATGKRRAAAEVALSSIDRAIRRRVPGHVLQWAGTLAIVIATTDDQGALVLSTWAEQRGLVDYENSAFPASYGAAAIASSRSLCNSADLERVTLTASALTEAGIASFARERLDLLPP